MWGWAARFLKRCNWKDSNEGTIHTLRLGLYSRLEMHKLVEESGIEFHYQKRGIVHIFTRENDMPHAYRQADFQVPYGSPYEKLTRDECVALEPSLKPQSGRICGGMRYTLDETGDIFAYCKELAKKAATLGVIFKYDEPVTALKRDGDQIRAVVTSAGTYEPDAVVMALGAYSQPLLRTVGIKLPIYPMKGYSISVTIDDPEKAPIASVTNQMEKQVYTRIGNILRVAGTAEFAGYNHDINPVRTRLLKESTKFWFAGCGDVDAATEWACLRPQSPDGCAVLGKTPYRNLWLNTGQGTLGWTLCAGSAKAVCDLLEGKTPEVDLTGLTIDRF